MRCFMQAHSNCKGNLEQIHEEKKKKGGGWGRAHPHGKPLINKDRNRSYKKQGKYKTK